MLTTDSKNVIIADDSVFFRTKLSDILLEAGHTVACARDGKEFIAKITSDNYKLNLLILDLQMPEVDGFGVLNWLKESAYAGRFPVLVATGVYEAKDVVDKLRKLNVSGFMTKASTPEQIIFRVHNLLFPNKDSHRSLVQRVPVSVPVDFSNGDTPSHTGFIQNIGESGTFLHTNEPFLVGTKLRLWFTLPGIDKLFDITGIIEWSTSNNLGQRTLFGGYGIMFKNITNEDRGCLNDFVESELSKLTYKEL